MPEPNWVGSNNKAVIQTVFSGLKSYEELVHGVAPSVFFILREVGNFRASGSTSRLISSAGEREKSRPFYLNIFAGDFRNFCSESFHFSFGIWIVGVDVLLH